MRARRKHRAGCGDQECWGGVGAYQEKECFKQKKQFKVLRETVLVTSSWEHWRVKNMCVCVYVCVLVVQSCWLFATPWTVAHQAPPSMEFSRQEYWSEKKKKKRILEWVVIPFSRGSSWLRDQTQVSCIAGRFFSIWATREAQRMCRTE